MILLMMVASGGRNGCVLVRETGRVKGTRMWHVQMYPSTVLKGCALSDQLILPPSMSCILPIHTRKNSIKVKASRSMILTRLFIEG